MFDFLDFEKQYQNPGSKLYKNGEGFLPKCSGFLSFGFCGAGPIPYVKAAQFEPAPFPTKKRYS